MKSLLERDLSELVVAAECHYSWARGNDKIENARFLVPFSNSHKRKAEEQEEQEELYTAQRNYNKKIRKIRAHVESLFGTINNRFKCLEKVFWEG